MKQVTNFLAGAVAGALLFWGASSLIESNQDEKAQIVADILKSELDGLKEMTNDEPKIEFFKTPGECIGIYKYEVTQVLKPGYAFAVELKKGHTMDLHTDKIVLFYNPKHNQYYDHQIIEIPKGYCARHIGICKHGYGGKETAPIVQIMRK